MCPREWELEANEESSEKVTEEPFICEINKKHRSSGEVVN